jgi:DNA-binding NarL/FixJ family response regulator
MSDETQGGMMGQPAAHELKEDHAKRFKVLIADDHPLMLAGIRRLLERSEDIEVVGEAHSGPEVMRLLESRRPQVALVDLRMPGVAGVDCIEQIRSAWPEVKVVVLSASEDRASIDSALRAGASAYVVKTVQPTDIASVLRQVMTGTVFHTVSRPAGMPDDGPAPSLTERESAILEAVAAGNRTAEISKELWISEHTVKFHLTNIYRKLEVSNRTAAVRCALEQGLIRR